MGWQMTPTAVAAEKVLAIKFRCIKCLHLCGLRDVNRFEWLFLLHICFSVLFFISFSLFLSLVLPLSLPRSFPYIHMQLCPLCPSDTKNSHSVRICVRRMLVTVCSFCVFILIHSLECEWCACHRLEAMTTKCYSIRAYSIVNIRLRKEQQRQHHRNQNAYRVRRVRSKQHGSNNKFLIYLYT